MFVYNLQGLIETEKVNIDCEKVPKLANILANKIATQWWPNIIIIRSPNKLHVTFIFYFLVIMFTLCSWFDQKNEVAFNGGLSFT